MRKPVVRDDLRILGGDLELDSVIEDKWSKKLAIGEHKLFVNGVKEVEKFRRKAQLIQERANAGSDAYLEFCGKQLGLAFMSEGYSQSARRAVPNFCRKQGIGLFMCNGRAISLGWQGLVPGQGAIKFV